ncbi:uncharacterized protein LOC122510521 [Leptopilina heterotoma]|uniref:uncharacterized protein LOC122510521 n=1 Tax=Leptopilina heterotoma TaxID=63436 RepID=UPI001CA7BDB3|nr:uncharacterized protein LOC122510521 [Leptopilina heterotoma]XP_043481177.1 uncharacterized protein LOC122510521 [Leptopilina heterotoma]XP_043481178.1 uncharacterized protein LOC122510521 [Leptopilina heterotoma]
MFANIHKMMTYHSLCNYFVTFFIVTMWIGTVVISMNVTEEEFRKYGIEFMDYDESVNDAIDTLQSAKNGTLTSFQEELLQKWNIDVNIEDLNVITEKFINTPTGMARKLMMLILGKDILCKMTIKGSRNFRENHSFIPENVSNFVFEYVNLHARSNITYSKYVKVIRDLCNYSRYEKRGNHGSLNSLQAELLEKWNIDVNIEKLNVISNNYIDRPTLMTRKLMILILGKNKLCNMTIRGSRAFSKFKFIPATVNNLVLDFVNSSTRSGITNSTYVKTVKKLCYDIRKGKKSVQVRRVSGDESEDEEDPDISDGQ